MPSVHSATRARRPLPRKGRDPSRVFIIRGDLRSSTGYGRATQALAKLLSDRFEVVGVDLYPNPEDANGCFPYRLLSDEDIPALIAREDSPPFILNYTIPSAFLYHSGAVNIGSFYWETEAIPFSAAWPDLIQSMDYFWAPTSFVADFVRKCGYRGSITLVTWSHDFQPIVDRKRLQGIQASYIPFMKRNATSRKISLERLRAQSDNLFLAMQSMAPRKGLPILLSEWRDYVASTSSNDVLLLKLRFMHTSHLRDDPIAQFHEVLEETGFRNGDATRIAMISDHFSEEATQDLYALTDAYITASYGEGFGGSIAEALCNDRLVISPRHTGMTDLLSPEYPLVVDTLPRHVALRGQPAVYPHSSIWQLPKRGAIRSAISKFVGMSLSERTMTLASAKSHLAAFCSVGSVRRSLAAFFDALEVGGATK